MKERKESEEEGRVTWIQGIFENAVKIIFFYIFNYFNILVLKIIFLF